MEKYINKLISLGMTREDAEMFIDGILGVRSLEPVRAILPTYYKIKTIDLDTNKDFGYIKFDVGVDAKFYDYDTVRKIYTYLIEHDTYKQAFQSGVNICFDNKPWRAINRDWMSHVKYVTVEGNIFYIKVDWEAKNVGWIIIPFYDY